MSDVHIYGIKNCDTMKKALRWLKERGVAVAFHDYKKVGVDEAVIRTAIDQHGWEQVLNRRGTTWRALPDDVKNSVDAARAVDLALENPSLIKRPLLSLKGQIYLGFQPVVYEELFPD